MMKNAKTQPTPITKGQLRWVIVCEAAVLLNFALQFMNMLSVKIWNGDASGSFRTVLCALRDDVPERYGKLFWMISALFVLGMVLQVFSVLLMQSPLVLKKEYRTFHVLWPLYSVLYMLLGQIATLLVFRYKNGEVTLHFGFWCCVGSGVLALGLLLVALIGKKIALPKTADCAQ